MMVDRSGIVWRMKFNKMTDERLLDLKRQDKLILDFLNTYAIELEAISGMNMTSDKQSMLSVEFVDALSKLVKFKISGMLANPLTDKLGRCVKDLKIIREETKGLRELNEVAFNVDNHSKGKDFVDSVREITQVFGKYGIEVYPDIPGRVQKMWKDK